MSDVLRRLAIELGIDTAVFEEGLKEARHMFTEAMEEIGKSAVVDGELIAEGLKKGIEHMKEMAEEAIEYGAHLADMAEKYGVTTEAISDFTVAAALSGTNIDQVAVGMRHLNDTMSKAAGGNAEAQAVFKSLGVSFKDAEGHIRSASEVMDDIAEKFHGAENDANKTAMAVALFGKAGDDLIPMLNKGKEGMDEAAEASKRLGLQMSGPQAEAARKVEEDLKMMHLQVQGNANAMMQGLMPALDAIAKSFAGTGKSGEYFKTVGEDVGIALKVMTTGAQVLEVFFEEVGTTIAKVAAAAWEAVQGHFQQAFTILKDSSDYHQQHDELMKIGDAWSDAGADAKKAGEEMEEAHKKSIGAVPQKEKKEHKHKDFEGENKHLREESDKRFNEWEGQERKRIEAEFQMLNKKIMGKKELENKSYADEQESIQEALRWEVITQQQADAALVALEVEHKKKLKAIDDEATAKKMKKIQEVEDFTKNSLDEIGHHSKMAAQASKLIAKEQALAKIYADTASAATAAASAVAGIPVIGPALATAASAAMYALGAAAAANVVSGGSGTGGGSSIGASVPSISPSSQATQPGQTIIHIPHDKMISGGDMINWINDALGDGHRLNITAVPA